MEIFTLFLSGRSQRVKNYVVVSLSVILALLSFERWTLFNSVSGDPVDGSWSIALNLIKQLQLQYGRDIVFTYGPLGYLGSTRLPIAINPWQIFTYDLWLIVQTAVIIWLIFRNNFTVQSVISVVVVIAILYYSAGGDPPFLYFYFVLFLLCSHLRTGNTLWLLNALGITVFTFFVKGNVGLVCLGCFFLYITYYTIWHKVEPKWYILLITQTIALILLGSVVLHVNPYEYVVTTLHIIDSYNDVMRYYDDNGEQVLLVAVVVMGLYGLSLLQAAWSYRKGINKNLADDLVVIGLASLALFVLFKEGFVRADRGHYSLFFKYAFLPLSLPVVFLSKSIMRRNSIIIGLVVVAGQLVYCKPSFHFNHPKQLAHYVGDIFQPVYTKPDTFQRLPAHWLDQLRRASVDVMPNNISAIYLNGLSHVYRPRPVFQSYQVTNRFLDSLNTSFYQSSRAPEFILYSNEVTDNRYFHADEVRTRLAMLRYYDYIDRFDKEGILLLKRRASPLRMDTLSVHQRSGNLQSAITVPSDSGLYVMQMQIAYSLLGKVVRLLFQPPTLILELETADGKWHSYQASTTLLANGFIANKWVADSNHLREFVCSKGQNGMAIRQVRINSLRWAWALKPTIKITQTQMKL